MDFGAYQIGPATCDEMFGPDGAPREHGLPLHEAPGRLSAADLGELDPLVFHAVSLLGVPGLMETYRPR